MITVWVTVSAFAIAITTVGGQETGNTCQNGGTCRQPNGVECALCECRLGYAGSDCSNVLTKVLGSLSFTTTGSLSTFVFNETGFKDRLKVIYQGYENSVVKERESSASGVINYVVYIQRPVDWSSFNFSQFKLRSEAMVKHQDTIDAAFSNSSGISTASANTDIDECASNLYTCVDNAECYNTDSAYGCTCTSGYSGDNTTSCTEIYCLWSHAPSWPSSANRTVTYPNGTDASKSSHGDRMPYKTFIEYECPNGFSLVNSATGEAQTTVIECVGRDQPTHENNGWTGNDVRCDMTVEFMVAIVIAAISSAIIVLVGGAFIVSHTKKKEKDENDTEVLEMDGSVGNASN